MIVNDNVDMWQKLFPVKLLWEVITELEFSRNLRFPRTSHDKAHELHFNGTPNKQCFFFPSYEQPAAATPNRSSLHVTQTPWPPSATASTSATPGRGLEATGIPWSRRGNRCRRRGSQRCVQFRNLCPWHAREPWNCWDTRPRSTAKKSAATLPDNICCLKNMSSFRRRHLASQNNFPV